MVTKLRHVTGVKLVYESHTTCTSCVSYMLNSFHWRASLTSFVFIIVPHDVRTNSKLRTRTWPQKEAQSLRMLYLSDMLHCEGPGPLWTVLPRAPGRRGTASLGREIEAERRGPWRGCTSPQPPPLGICIRLWEDSSDTWQKVLTVFRRLCRDFLVREMTRKELGNFGIWNTANRFWTRCV